MGLDQHDEGNPGDGGVNVHLCGGFPFPLVRHFVFSKVYLFLLAVSLGLTEFVAHILPTIPSQCALTA